MSDINTNLLSILSENLSDIDNILLLRNLNPFEFMCLAIRQNKEVVKHVTIYSIFTDEQISVFKELSGEYATHIDTSIEKEKLEQEKLEREKLEQDEPKQQLYTDFMENPDLVDDFFFSSFDIDKMSEIVEKCSDHLDSANSNEAKNAYEVCRKFVKFIPILIFKMNKVTKEILEDVVEMRPHEIWNVFSAKFGSVANQSEKLVEMFSKLNNDDLVHDYIVHDSIISSASKFNLLITNLYENVQYYSNLVSYLRENKETPGQVIEECGICFESNQTISIKCCANYCCNTCILVQKGQDCAYCRQPLQDLEAPLA